MGNSTLVNLDRQVNLTLAIELSHQAVVGKELSVSVRSSIQLKIYNQAIKELITGFTAPSSYKVFKMHWQLLPVLQKSVKFSLF